MQKYDNNLNRLTITPKLRGIIKANTFMSWDNLKFLLIKEKIISGSIKKKATITKNNVVLCQLSFMLIENIL